MQKIIYEDKNLLAINKPAGLITCYEKENKIFKEKTLIDLVLKEKQEIKNTGLPPRYGIIHRLDKNTSGIILIAKNNKSLEFFQKQFKDKKVEKRYLALIYGHLKDKKGRIETLIGRSIKDRKKQAVYLSCEPYSEKKRTAITEYKCLEKFSFKNKKYSLIEVTPITGRKHQIRVHLKHLNYPIIGDNIYGFKGQKDFKELNRHFLHANYIKIKIPGGEIKEFKSDLPEELKKIITELKTEG